MSTDSESGKDTVSGSSFETLVTCEDIEESDLKAQAKSAPISPTKAELWKSNEPHALVIEEEDGCPICLEGEKKLFFKLRFFKQFAIAS